RLDVPPGLLDAPARDEGRCDVLRGVKERGVAKARIGDVSRDGRAAARSQGSSGPRRAPRSGSGNAGELSPPASNDRVGRPVGCSAQGASLSLRQVIQISEGYAPLTFGRLAARSGSDGSSLRQIAI